MRVSASGDKYILGIILTLLATGLVMVYSSSHIYAYERFHDSNYFLKKSLIAISVSLVFFIFFANFPYQKLRNYSIPLFAFSLFTLAAIFIFPSFAPRIGGATRWIRLLGPIQFQPSEVSKLAIILYLAALFSKKKTAPVDYLHACGVVGITCLLILKEPNFSTAFLLGMLAMIIIFFNGLSLSIFTGSLLLIGVVAFHHMRTAAYRWQRITGFLDPWQDPYGSGYHIIHSLIAIGSGGWFGVGLGNSLQKFNYLPDPFTDFIFSIISEELGFVGAGMLVLLYVLLMHRMIRIIIAIKDKFAFLLLIGIMNTLLLQVLINIGVTVRLFPTTGVTLPFISFGGSSLVINMVMLGIIYNISKNIDHQGQSREEQ
ncbi:MAG: putative lipid II flippase FtsW [Candidatus Wallbacteria bacterium]|nr:putative lipid II flippase FtsW [Candidatus Wallbacteria bacterium]